MSKISILIKEKRGITLTEVLFSVAIISLVVVSVLLIFAQTVDMSRRVDHEYIATNIAKSRLERARTVIASSGFDSLPDLEEDDTILDEDGMPDPNGDFKRTTTVGANYAGNARLTEVRALATYRYGGEWRENAEIAITTVFTNIQ